MLEHDTHAQCHYTMCTSNGLTAEPRLQLLVENFNVAAANNVMCRNTVNVGWDGRIFDCDFNQQLDMGMRCAKPCTAASAWRLHHQLDLQKCACLMPVHGGFISSHTCCKFVCRGHLLLASVQLQGAQMATSRHLCSQDLYIPPALSEISHELDDPCRIRAGLST